MKLLLKLMKKEIVKKGGKLLRSKCEPVTDFEVARQIVTALIETINYLKTTHEFKRGLGLAAPQIGENKRISVVEFDNEVHVLINPQILVTSKEKTPIREGCISFLEYRAHVPRYTYVKVKAYDINGKEYTVEGYGDSAMLLQHELDHLEGILYIDYLPHGENDLFKA